MQRETKCSAGGLCALDTCSLTICELGVTLNRIKVLEGVSFEVRCGEVTAIIGPNGAGKSTLLKAILGLVPYAGHVHFCHNTSHGGGAPRIGYMPQKLDFDRSMPLTVLEFFAMASGSRPAFLGVTKAARERAEKSLAAVEAEHLINRQLGGLSGGELQRALFALATDPLPHILIMDEPIAGIDVTGEALLHEMISKMRGNMELSVIVVSHDLSMVTKLTDHVICLNRKVICQGSAENILTADTIRETFGSHVGFYRHGKHNGGEE